MTSASKKTKDLLKECVNEDKKNAIRNKILKEEENKLNKKIINRQKQQQKKEEFKKLPKKEQERIKLEEKLKKNKIEYIEDAIKNIILYKNLKKEYENENFVVCDPGKEHY